MRAARRAVPLIPANGMMERMLQATELNAKNGAALAEILRDMKNELQVLNRSTLQLSGVMERTETLIQKSDLSLNKGRDDAVVEVKNHISREIKANAVQPLIGWLIAGSAVVSAAALTALAVVKHL